VIFGLGFVALLYPQKITLSAERADIFAGDTAAAAREWDVVGH
jgi:hypothetical protein